MNCKDTFVWLVRYRIFFTFWGWCQQINEPYLEFLLGIVKTLKTVVHFSCANILNQSLITLLDKIDEFVCPLFQDLWSNVAPVEIFLFSRSASGRFVEVCPVRLYCLILNEHKHKYKIYLYVCYLFSLWYIQYCFLFSVILQMPSKRFQDWKTNYLIL